MFIEQLINLRKVRIETLKFRTDPIWGKGLRVEKLWALVFGQFKEKQGPSTFWDICSAAL